MKVKRGDSVGIVSGKEKWKEGVGVTQKVNVTFTKE